MSDKAAAGNFVAHANIYRRRADHAATVMRSQLGALAVSTRRAARLSA